MNPRDAAMSKRAAEDEEFAAQVHDVVHQLASWIREQRPDDTRLMPALAVVLGRVIASSASSEEGLERLLEHAHEAMRRAAKGRW